MIWREKVLLEVIMNLEAIIWFRRPVLDMETETSRKWAWILVVDHDSLLPCALFWLPSKLSVAIPESPRCDCVQCSICNQWIKDCDILTWTYLWFWHGSEEDSGDRRHIHTHTYTHKTRTETIRHDRGLCLIFAMARNINMMSRVCGGKGRGEQDDDRSSRRSLVVKPRKAYEQHCGTFCFFSRNCRVNGRPVDPVFLEITPHCPGELASELLWKDAK